MGAFERWLHNVPERTPSVLKAALGHVQFETIHPFLDGNGRVGRLLVTLLLCWEEVLHEPLLYLSLYLKQRRAAYYELLDMVRAEGDWEAWVDFFAEGVRESAEGAVGTVQRLARLTAADRERIRGLARISGTALQVHLTLQERPLAAVGTLAERAGLSFPAVNKALAGLAELGIVREITGRRRNRLYTYDAYLRILSEGTE